MRALGQGEEMAEHDRMPPPTNLAPAEERLVALWARLVAVLGLPTVRALLDRAIWQTAPRHPDLALLQHDEGGLSFEALEQRYATRSQEEIAAAVNDLIAELRLILARLVGREVARRLTEDRAAHEGSTVSSNDDLL